MVVGEIAALPAVVGEIAVLPSVVAAAEVDVVTMVQVIFQPYG